MRKNMETPGQLTMPTVDALLAGRDDLLDELRALVKLLDDERSFAEACAVLHALAAALAKGEAHLLSIQRIQVPGSSEPISLILHPAIFAPESWGKAFAEGLLKTASNFNGKSVLEIGTGSGWISILLVLRTKCARVLALDINPVAVILARLNIWLNGSDPCGNIRKSQAGVPIPEAIRVAESDLLDVPLAGQEKFDRIIGCIPQVLHPDPAATERSRARYTDQDLYDLSNYCFSQGILEDRFGLPLIARALEQSQLCLNQQGQLTFILGGRPGPLAIESMFRRRGFMSELIWSRRIRQADDTDLASLVKLEQRYGIKFNFFLSESSSLPVPASTAVLMLESGQAVYHDLLVYQATTSYEQATLQFVRNIHHIGLESLRRELDFSRISEEQISFLSRLTAKLLQSRTIPYPHERGDLSLREKLAQFLHCFCQLDVEADRLFLAPERSQLVFLLAKMLCLPGKRVLVSQSLESVYKAVLEQCGLEVVVGNDDFADLMLLDDVLQPAMVFIAPEQLRSPSSVLCQAMCTHASRHPERWYLLDDSEQFNIGSELKANLLLKLIGQQSLAPNVVLIYGLIKNTVFPDMELSFMVNAPADWVDGLDVGAELTYSRIPYLSQLYYEWLLDELLSFSMEAGESAGTSEGAAAVSRFSSHFEQAAGDPVFWAKPVDPQTPGVIRLDYGEFEYPVPDLLLRGIIKGLLESPVEGLRELVIDRMLAYLQATRTLSVAPEQVVLGQGVFPLLSALLKVLNQRLGRAPLVAVPDGSYGPCYPLLVYHGAKVVPVRTRAEDGFNLKAEQLQNLSVRPDLIWITQPNNPSGLYLQPEEIARIIDYCQSQDSYLLADEIFFLLSDISLGEATPENFSFGSYRSASKHLFLADGLSKTFAAGGLRCGFMVTPDQSFAQQMQSMTSLPTKSALRAWDTLFSAFLPEAPHQMMDLNAERANVQRYLTAARHKLSLQRASLLELLRRHDRDDGIDTMHRGGLFMLARLDAEAERLARETLLLVNPGKWGRTGQFVRVCFCLSPERFKTAMDRLERFLVRLGR